MKKWLSLVITFCLLTSLCPTLTVQARTLPVKSNAYTLYNPQKGLGWLSNQEEIVKLVEEADSLPKADDSIYDMAKKSVIIKLSDRVSYVNGYATYIDSKNEEVRAVLHNGMVYIPAHYVNINLGINVSFNEESGIASIKKQEELSLVAGKTTSSENSEEYELALTPYKAGDTLLLPLRPLCEIMNKKVLYKNGVIIITDEDGEKLIKEEHWTEIQKEDFALSRDKVLQPQPQAVMRWIMSSGDRSRLNYKDEQIAEYVNPFLNMSYYELADYVDKKMLLNDAGEKRHIGERPADFEIAALLMGLLYERNPSEDLAIRIIIMCYHSAIRFDDLATYDWNSFYNYSYVTPCRLIYAYTRIYHSPMWEIVSEGYGFDVREATKYVWRIIFDYITASCYREDGTASTVGNYPVKLGHMAGTAFALDDPDAIRMLIPVLDSAIGKHSFYADGMWYEGSFDYGNQMVGNSDAAGILLAAYTDPLGYVDEKYGIQFNNSFNRKRWSNYFAYVSSLSNLAYMPDGSRLAVNDTHWTDVAKNLADNTIKEQYIKDNVEMNHFGLYALRYGDTEEAQQLNLSLTPTTNVSHQHSGPLTMSYFTAGMEVFPDQGYITPTTLHRYSKTPAFGHNTAYIYPEKEAPIDGSYFARPNVYAYDDGHANGKQIQLIEASSLMPEYHGIDVNRRAMLMIATDKNHSYAVDIHRIAGGTPSESYLMQSEEEDVELETNLKLEPKYEGPLYEWLASKGAYGGYINTYTQYSKVYKNPEGLVTDDDFWFSFKGKTTGTTVKAYIKGDDNAVVAFAEHPTIRRTNKDVAKKNDFPGFYFYRRNNEEIGKVTTYAGVYEGYKEGDTPRVLNVEWQAPKDQDEMTTMLKVELEKYVDYIYISNDLSERELSDYSFSGSYCVLRTDKESGKVVYSYIYGDGAIKKGDEVIADGKEDLSYRVIMAQGSRPVDNDVPNELKLQGVPPEDIKGFWGNVTFSDGSGNAFCVEDVKQSVITIHNDPGFYVTEEGATFTAYPMYEDEKYDGRVSKFASTFIYGMKQRQTEGKVIFTIKRPTFNSK